MGNCSAEVWPEPEEAPEPPDEPPGIELPLIPLMPLMSELLLPPPVDIGTVPLGVDVALVGLSEVVDPELLVLLLPPPQAVRASAAAATPAINVTLRVRSTRSPSAVTGRAGADGRRRCGAGVRRRPGSPACGRAR
ncbi:hypothetical protein GCM10011594_23030 [Nakamurella endophytica]|uniref:Uncharacterized protein n=1 Tax=Nakamurella endophytica TaxID=1748367 RepID=A0A917WGJ8_9ACTN|nr:hypothetical protein GCM10011594_23030 [Nakamurella endophytica]